MKCIKYPKKCCLFFVFSLIFLLSSCLGHHSIQQKIDNAFLVLKQNPDSALLLIEELELLNNKSEYEDANVKLLKYYALYKTSDNPLPDSLIDQSRNYFIQSNFKFQKAISFYLTGCSREIRNQSDSAVFWYKMADITFSESDEYTDIKGLIKYNLGYMYLQHNHVDYAMRYLKDAFEILNSCNNFKYMAYVLKDISYCYYLSNNNSEIYLNILDEAYLLSKSCGDELNCDYILAQKGEFLYETNKKESKELIRNHLIKYPNSSDKLSSYLADLYIDELKFDSARLYINSLDVNNYRNKVLHNLVNFKFYQKGNNLEKSINFLLLANNLKDSLSYDLQNSKVTEIDKKIELSTSQNEIKSLKFSNLSILLFLLILLIILVFIVIKLIKNKINYTKENKYLLEKIEYFESEMFTISTFNNEKKILLHNTIINKTTNTLALRNLELKTRDENKIIEFVKDSYINNLINEKEWEVFFEEIDQIFDKKLSNLVTKYQLTLNDQKVISFISLKFDITDCCLLLNLTKNTLYHRRQLIKERLSLSKDTDLDVWISQYLTADPVPAAMLPSPVAP